MLRRRVFCLSLGLDFSRSVQRDEPAAAVRAALRLPFASVLRQVVRHRPGTRSVPAASIVMGAQARLDGCGFADAIGTVRYGSTPMATSPYVALLRTAIARGAALTDAELADSEYVAFATRMMEEWGDYFGATTPPELLDVARNFVEWAVGQASRVITDSGSRPEDDVLVARVAGSDVFQVIDGHHRVGVAIAHGATEVPVRRTWLPTESPLRRRLAARGGRWRRPELDQPLEARDLADGVVVANCQSRLLRMVNHLRADERSGRRFLDLGCASGWYLAELKRRGWSVLGVTGDPFDRELADGYHGIAAGELVVGEPAAVAESLAGPFDAVSCLGLGALAGSSEGRDDAIRLAHAADRLGASVLFCDDPSTRHDGAGVLAPLVLQRTGFTRLVDLGWTDDPPEARRASRLVAFVREGR